MVYAICGDFGTVLNVEPGLGAIFPVELFRAHNAGEKQAVARKEGGKVRSRRVLQMGVTYSSSIGTERMGDKKSRVDSRMHLSIRRLGSGTAAQPALREVYEDLRAG
jgi:hypothetical protein